MDAKPRTQPSPSPFPCLFVVILAVLLAMFAGLAVASGANASTWSPLQREGAALSWAETQTGAPYVWAGTGPYRSGYDCSGLVVAAFAREGLALPHNTELMLYSGHLHRVYNPQRGDLAMWFVGGYAVHVEFVTAWYHTSFGAHTYGSPVGWAQWGGWWYPGAFYRVY